MFPAPLRSTLNETCPSSSGNPVASATAVVTQTIFTTPGAPRPPTTIVQAGGVLTTTVTVTPSTTTFLGVLTTTTTTYLPVSRSTTTTTLEPSPTYQEPPPAAVNTAVPLDTVCAPGDAGQKYDGILSATPPQRTTLCKCHIFC